MAESEITVQLTADQQVALSISGEDKYDNPVDITGETVWSSTDESIVTVTADASDPTKAIAAAVGPVGTAAVTVSNDVNSDGTGDFQGSIAIDVVAGEIAEIIINEGEVGTKGVAPDQGLPPGQGGTPDQGLPPGQGGTPDQGLPGAQPGPDNSLPGAQPGPDQGLPGGSGGRPDQGLPGEQPGPDNSLPGAQPGPDQGLPGGSGGRPDNSLPGSQPGPDQGLPGEQPGVDNELPNRPLSPDQGLPETPSPKGRHR